MVVPGSADVNPKVGRLTQHRFGEPRWTGTVHGERQKLPRGHPTAVDLAGFSDEVQESGLNGSINRPGSARRSATADSHLLAIADGLFVSVAGTAIGRSRGASINIVQGSPSSAS